MANLKVRELATGLRFPEGPIAMPDGSVILVEIARGTLSRVTPAGKVEVVANLGGGPNGAAMGPDNCVYVTNNGGFTWHEHDGHVFTDGSPSADYKGGSIQRVNLANGKVETLYTECDGVPFAGPNDLVFDHHGGFYFTDLGKVFGRNLALGGLFYAKADGSSVKQLAFPVQLANGCGLSPDGKTVYVAQTYTGWLVKWNVTAPGEIAPSVSGIPGDLVGKSEGRNLFDSLAVEADGRVCVATIGGAPSGGISVIEPSGKLEFLPFDDPAVTNICFGGKDMKTAYLTLSGYGRLLAVDWPRPGLKLAHQEV
jgi:gluconolactonase